VAEDPEGDVREEEYIRAGVIEKRWRWVPHVWPILPDVGDFSGPRACYAPPLAPSSPPTVP